MKYFYSASTINKKIRSLQTLLDMHLSLEKNSSVFIREKSEDIEDARPIFDFEVNNDEIFELINTISELKHVINVFNTTEKLPCGLYIDEVLVLLPMYTKRKQKLERLLHTPEKQRLEGGYGNHLVEYRHINFDTTYVKDQYDLIVDSIDYLHSELDAANAVEKIELDINLDEL